MRKEASLIIICIAVFSISLGGVYAQEIAANINEAMERLGCGDKAECKSFCDATKNREICIKIAKEFKLMSNEAIAKAERVITSIKEKRTPEGCDSVENCREVCSKEINFDKCLEFSLENRFIDETEAKDLKELPCHGDGCIIYCAQTDECEKIAKTRYGISTESARIASRKKILGDTKVVSEVKPVEFDKSKIEIGELKKSPNSGVKLSPENLPEKEETFERIDSIKNLVPTGKAVDGNDGKRILPKVINWFKNLV